jgi:5-methyltetrahydrofolate--homocysteine methyltransferase
MAADRLLSGQRAGAGDIPLIVGELFNVSRKVVLENAEQRNVEYFRDIARKQVAAGAHYLDVNASKNLAEEIPLLTWMIETIQEVVDLPLAVDSPNAAAMAAGLALTRHGQPMLNSITAEKERYTAMLPLALEYRTRIVALCMDEGGIPATAAQRLPVARRLIANLTAAGVQAGDIYLDLLVQPLALSDRAAVEVLQAVRTVREEFPEVHVISALSNVSFGLPSRRVLNRVFMVQALSAGMDSFILDPLDGTLVRDIYPAQALLGRDRYCGRYLAAHRNHELDVE